MLMNQMTQMNQAQLLHWINMVSFAVVDITEYLDTHPIDAEAICYFNHHIEMRRNAMQVYADKFGPLTIDTANPDAYWDWAKPVSYTHLITGWRHSRNILRMN